MATRVDPPFPPQKHDELCNSKCDGCHRRRALARWEGMSATQRVSACQPPVFGIRDYRKSGALTPFVSEPGQKSLAQRRLSGENAAAIV